MALNSITGKYAPQVGLEPVALRLTPETWITPLIILFACRCAFGKFPFIATLIALYAQAYENRA